MIVSYSTAVTRSATINGYTRLQKWLHWIVGALVLMQWLTGDGAARALDAVERGETPAVIDFLLVNLHLCSGLSILVIVIWRLRLRQRRSAGVALEAPGRSRDLARATHIALYLTLMLLPLTGIMTYYELLPGAARWHNGLGWWFCGLLVLHLAGFLLRFSRKDESWRRMFRVSTDL